MAEQLFDPIGGFLEGSEQAYESFMTRGNCAERRKSSAACRSQNTQVRGIGMRAAFRR
jgi:hypothetical protein